MAVCLETKVQKWNCYSTDVKPSSAPEGSMVHTIDTGEEFVYHNGMWERDLRLINAIKMANV